MSLSSSNFAYLIDSFSSWVEIVLVRLLLGVILAFLGNCDIMTKGKGINSYKQMNFCVQIVPLLHFGQILLGSTSCIGEL